MRSAKTLHVLQALLVSGFTLFALGFSHITFGQPSMPGMEEMTSHTGSSAQCKLICTTAVESDRQGVLSNLKRQADDPLDVALLLGTVSLLLVAIRFVVKRLYLLASWRPPDRILLCGHYADGL